MASDNLPFSDATGWGNKPAPQCQAGGMVNDRSNDDVTVVPPDVYDAMQASLDEPDEPNLELTEAAAEARRIVTKPQEPFQGSS